MHAKPGLTCVLGVVLLSWITCTSTAPSLNSNSQQTKPETEAPSPAATVTGASQPPVQGSGATAISYAKHPERFVKQATYQPPFKINNPKTADEHFDVAVNHDNNKQFDKAINQYEQALILRPDWAIARFRLAEDLSREGRIDDAIAQSEQTLQGNPQFYPAYDLLAHAYKSKGDLRKAITVYSKLLKFGPAQMSVWYQLGVWYEQVGDRRKAREAFESYRDLAMKDDQERASTQYKGAILELQRLEQSR